MESPEPGSRSQLAAYFWHMRPKSWAVVAAHLTTGFFLAFEEGTASATASGWAALAGAAAIWAGLLNGGTLGLNTAYDKDEGDIGYLFKPPPIPPYLSLYAGGLLVLGLVLAPLVSMRYAAAYAACFVMSLLYSVPPVRLKAVPGLDLLVNCTGYGMLTLYAGYAAADLPLNPRVGWACAGFFCLFGALYPLTQIYQHDEDLAHGDRTLTVLLGKRPALWFAFGAMLAAFGCLTAHAWTSGWNAWALGIGLAFLSWCVVLIPWLIRGKRYPEKRGMYRALWAWAVTDAAVVLNALLG